MTTFPISPRLLKGAVVLIGTESAAVRHVAVIRSLEGPDRPLRAWAEFVPSGPTT